MVSGISLIYLSIYLSSIYDFKKYIDTCELTDGKQKPQVKLVKMYAPCPAHIPQSPGQNLRDIKLQEAVPLFSCASYVTITLFVNRCNVFTLIVIHFS